MTTLHSEAEFTAPHAACTRPDYWHAWDSDSTELEVTELVASLVRAIQPDRVLETGTAFGFTAFAIGQALKRNGHGLLDTFETDKARWDIARDRCSGLPVCLHLRSSLKPIQYESGESSLNFALFDSLYELRAKEFRIYRQWMKPGTIVCFHDWTSGLRGHYRDVRTDVEGLAADGLLRPVFVPGPRGLAIAEVL